MAEPFDLGLGDGLEWVVDAFGCDPAALRDPAPLEALFGQAVRELGLQAVGPCNVHAFPGHGGVTAMQLLSESHLTAHTFPERRYVAINLYCCRLRPDWPWAERLGAALGAERVAVRRILRPGPPT
jgi:S-adenosylmethionine decarboxylase